jgi:hypothetical protein
LAPEDGTALGSTIDVAEFIASLAAGASDGSGFFVREILLCAT